MFLALHQSRSLFLKSLMSQLSYFADSVSLFVSVYLSKSTKLKVFRIYSNIPFEWAWRKNNIRKPICMLLTLKQSKYRNEVDWLRYCILTNWIWIQILTYTAVLYNINYTVAIGPVTHFNILWYRQYWYYFIRWQSHLFNFYTQRTVELHLISR